MLLKYFSPTVRHSTAQCGAFYVPCSGWYHMKLHRRCFQQGRLFILYNPFEISYPLLCRPRPVHEHFLYSTVCTAARVWVMGSKQASFIAFPSYQFPKSLFRGLLPLSPLCFIHWNSGGDSPALAILCAFLAAHKTRLTVYSMYCILCSVYGTTPAQESGKEGGRGLLTKLPMEKGRKNTRKASFFLISYFVSYSFFLLPWEGVGHSSEGRLDLPGERERERKEKGQLDSTPVSSSIVALSEEGGGGGNCQGRKRRECREGHMSIRFSYCAKPSR